MRDLRRDDRFRFSLQWSADTGEKARVGALLEQLGNKKSDFIVIAVMEYLQQHPEAAIPGAKIKITYQPLQPKEQMLEMVKNMVKAAVEELLAGKTLVPIEEQPQETQAGPSDQDIDAMLAGLKLFD